MRYLCVSKNFANALAVIYGFCEKSVVGQE